MKTITLSLVALAALSGVAFANDRAEQHTAAWRNVHWGAVWATHPLVNEEMTYSDTEGFAAIPLDSKAQSDFAQRKLRGENFDNDN
ncbi:MAG TPA: hypothetical protein P5337_05635 [Aestuariivirga sp.]|nr:hypothetical protein [Alphaproteobacteria bacterium]HRX35857.1 hypothetical protein [Aestuariivirga sp.]